MLATPVDFVTGVTSHNLCSSYFTMQSGPKIRKEIMSFHAGQVFNGQIHLGHIELASNPRMTMIRSTTLPTTC
jgi:hypothetical protein